MTMTATLSLKELKSIIELSSAGRSRTGSNAGRHYRRRNTTLEAITCIATEGRARVMIPSRDDAKNFLRTMRSAEKSFRLRSAHISSFAK
ncbi:MULTISPECIES: hypothetical protein [unclassified Bradyrhizobium]|uniref:hypothetical protein n=1 Tax=unclassified Bradyrhizobium TaxID=2631580 RepID=UPI0020B21071|nr:MULTISPECIES: hypothetical protein [unclassified Bradyrhizobium]MCP3441591.1 hypothetical protein [Bradyrhizobium sp. CCGUVB14]WFU79769.1 hypothetical protein QA645_35590 [Bradyrhizobium sp. CIAT3101]